MEVGDIVKLNSGSPNMSIENVDNGYARCVWFSYEEAKVKVETLLIECLVPSS